MYDCEYYFKNIPLGLKLESHRLTYSDRLRHAAMIGLEGALCRKESPQMYGSSLCGGRNVSGCLHICECVYSEG